MSLFSRLFKPKRMSVGAGPHRELVDAGGLLLLAAREKRDDSLRRSPRFGELLGLLWQDDDQALTAVHDTFSSMEKLDKAYIKDLAVRLRTAQRRPPPSPTGRYEAVVEELSAEIKAMPLQPLPFFQLIVTAPAATRLLNVLTLARILLPPELHQPICELLVANNRACRGRMDDSVPYQPLIRENIHRFLALIDADAMPHFWEMVRNEAVSEEFWPALRRIRDRDAVPYLLDLLPAAHDEQGLSVMSLDGQKEVIQVLREIGDLRAVPALQAIEKRPLPPPVEKPGIQGTWERDLSKTWRERNDLARLAGQAARHILRNSTEAEAQLLRPSETPHTAGENLLRPTAPGSGTTTPDQLLRPAEETERTNRAP
jgi:hypothetical protein